MRSLFDPESPILQFITKIVYSVWLNILWFVCCIPVAEELDLKKAAAAAGEKSLTMMHVKDLEPTTGYVRGGCTPVGMKKQFPTLIDETAQLFDEIGISGGRRGISLRLDPEQLASFIGATFADIVR